jgi:hypothetical protein
MSRYLVSVGGSGQHVALAFTRLVKMGMLRHDFRLIAIDPDNDSPLSHVLEAPGGMRGQAHPLEAGNVFPPFDKAKFGEAEFSALFVDPHHPAERELFEAMYDDDMGTIPVHRGMFGTPCVGATVFGLGANGDELQNLLKPLTNATQVIVCGSVVGGTGAGVIHKLVQEIRRYYTRDMFGVFLLPWFQVQSGAAQRGAITPALISRNARHGIKYFYEHTIPVLDTSLLVGFPGNQSTSVLRPLVVGEGNMGENAHYLHLVAAWGASRLQEAHTAQRTVKSYGTIHDGDNEGWLLNEKFEHPEGRTLRDVVRAMRLTQTLLGFLTTKGRPAVTDYYHSGRAGRLVSSRTAWGEALHATISGNEPDVAKQGAFVDEMFAAFETIRVEHDFCASWIANMFPDALLQRAGGDPLSDQVSKGRDDVAFAWSELEKDWRGKPLATKASGKHNGRDAAAHHARVLFDALAAS